MEFARTVIMAALFGWLSIGLSHAQTGHPEYVGTKTCAECHEAEMEAWKDSHHALAWTFANEENVLGDFGSSTFSHKSEDWYFSKDENDFVVETKSEDGEETTYKVIGVAGIAPLQQYLVDIGDGHIQALDIAWDIENERWYHLYPDQDLPPGDGLHWTGPYKNWNARCAECHATGFEKNYNPASRRYQSRAEEIGVGCEACHGPAEAHLAWARDGETDLSTYGEGLTELGFTIDTAAEDPEVQIQQCAGCHSRREPFQNGNPLPGTPFHDAYRLSLLREGLYHPDGQILDEVYVYGSFLQSKMYANGVRCSDCHDVHTAEIKADDNSLCTQCHSPAGDDRFSTLRKAVYDDPGHHFHEPGSEGAQCKSCHMIERVYMGIDGRRDHSFRIPRPDLTETTGAPNACNDCHDDQSAQWAAAEIEKHFLDSENRGFHHGELFHQAWNGDSSTFAALMELAQDDSAADIVRASALDILQRAEDPQIAAQAVDLLKDDSPLVRSAAIVLQRAAPPTERVQRLSPLLSDPVSSVRMAAAREFLNAPIARMPPNLEQAYRSALDEWRAGLAMRADFPETHMVLGGTALVMRNLQAAEMAFRRTVDMDPQLVQAWSMIVRILDAQGNRESAKAALDSALEANPEDPGLLQLKSQYQ